MEGEVEEVRNLVVEVVVVVAAEWTLVDWE